MGEAVGEVLRVEGAVLERGQVPIDRGAGLSEVVLGSRQLGVPSLLPGRVAGLRRNDSRGDEVVLVAVEAGQRGDNRVLDSIGVQPARVATPIISTR